MQSESPTGELCPETAEIEALVGDALPEQRVEALLPHIGDCSKCQAKMDAVSGTKSFRKEFLTDPAEDLGDARCRDLVERMKRDTAPAEAEAEVNAEGIEHDVSTNLGFLTRSDKEGSLGKLGRFEVLEVIGQGGMGLVLRAVDPELERVVAIKVLSPALAASKVARQRFMREARSAAAIDHENVLPIHTVDRGGSLPFFTMPLVEGQSLQRLLDCSRSPLTVEQIVDIGGKIAAGLAAAHERGLIHRDIKPANILLDESGERVWLADFGLARAMEEPSVTRAGTLVGTPQFMAPEQLDDQPSSERSDLFSLGSVLYYMATGKPPFAAKSTASMIRKVMDSKPQSPAEANTALPAWLSELIEQLLRKDPGERPASATEVAETIDRNWNRSSQERSRIRHRWSITAATVALVAAILYLLQPSKPKPFQFHPNGKRFATLTEAVQAARDGELIEVVIPYTQLRERIDFKDKAITIRRAAEVPRAVLDFTALPNQPFSQAHVSPVIVTRSKLTLEDLTMVRMHASAGHADDPGHAPLIEAYGGIVRIKTCRFELQQSDGAPFAAVVLSGATGCHVSDSTFLHRNRGVAFLFRNPLAGNEDNLTVTLERNSFIGRSLLVFEHKIPRQIDLTMASNVIASPYGITFMADHAWAPINAASIVDNLFCISERRRPCVIRVPEGAAVDFKEHAVWTGNANTFASAVPTPFLAELPILREERRPQPIVRLSNWDKWTARISETEAQNKSLERPVTIPVETPLNQVDVRALILESELPRDE